MFRTFYLRKIFAHVFILIIFHMREIFNPTFFFGVIIINSWDYPSGRKTIEPDTKKYYYTICTK